VMHNAWRVNCGWRRDQLEVASKQECKPGKGQLHLVPNVGHVKFAEERTVTGSN
jgi:hypothetical protein